MPHDPAVSPSASPEAAPSSPSRRRVLLGMASAAPAVGLLGAAALSSHALAADPAPAGTAATAASAELEPATVAAFLKLSQALTAHADISPTTAARIYAALCRQDQGAAVRIATLQGLQQPGQSAATLQQAADAHGLGDLARAIVRAWYTGTVGTGQGAVVVAYAEALMYRTVSDGLIVPTYGNYGPIWWLGEPPPLGVPLIVPAAGKVGA
ncbi:sugar dehydrogenase complex small subunit [Frateuria defendens]|uniref:sugar dehydrogenase complex small subunit n=1 Tax=Frateuria defendens TaxID=2219559 RepID=UPI0007DBF371|nr:sugar dehydrogenase complex small subunit [Frateuria defendens]